MKQILPDDYKKLSDDALKDRIIAMKQKLGERVVVLGHHYQRDAVIEFADYRGDSLGLCQRAAEQKKAKYIVFCGVHFMAESADILTADEQIVQLPDLMAGCPLADFADIDDVEHAWKALESICGSNKITPITYINSRAELKAFCGRNGGAVCTSSNATSVLKWALNKTDKAFFFPDQHLGRNTANKLGISPDRILLWESHSNNTRNQIKQAQVILWPGYCHVHTFFTVDHIKQMREKYPDAKVVVHPECTEEVVKLSDDNGSTGYIIRYVERAPAGSTIIVGTELNLVLRLASVHKNKTILPLARSLCPNMYKINLNTLCWTLENPGKVNIIKISNEIKTEAKIALNQMLTL